VDGLPEGPSLSRARMERALLSADREARGRALETAAAGEGPWSRLAALELRARALRLRVALDEPRLRPPPGLHAQPGPERTGASEGAWGAAAALPARGGAGR